MDIDEAAIYCWLWIFMTYLPTAMGTDEVAMYCWYGHLLKCVFMKLLSTADMSFDEVTIYC